MAIVLNGIRLVETLMQFFASFKEGYKFFAYLDLLPGFGVAAKAWFSFLDGKSTKATQLNAVTCCQTICDATKNRIHQQCRLSELQVWVFFY